MESYYHPNTVTVISESPYLNEDELSNFTSSSIQSLSRVEYIASESVPKLPTLYDEETHALLHPEPVLDVLLQSRPLVWSFNGIQFDTPDRFLPKDASIYSNDLMANHDIYALNEYFKNTSINNNDIEPLSPVKMDMKQDIDKPFIQLTDDNDDVSISIKQPFMYEIDAPWWCSDSNIKHINDKCVDNNTLTAPPISISSPLLPLPGVKLITSVDDTPCSIGIQSSPHVEQVKLQEAPIMIQVGTDASPSSLLVEVGTDASPSTLLVEASTQCFINTVPRIVIDAVTGTDEMERDISNYSRRASVSTGMENEDESKLSPDALYLMELECNLAAQIPLPLVTDDDESPESLDTTVKSEDVLLSPDSDDFEFVEIVEAAE